MKIYFMGSIRGGREDQKIYEKMIAHIKKYGHEVLTEHVADGKLKAYGEIGPSDKKIHDRDLEWLYESDAFIADMSQPSNGVGYEQRVAEERMMPNISLFRTRKGRRASPMIAGSDRLNVVEYRDLKEALKIIDGFLIGLKKLTD